MIRAVVSKGVIQPLEPLPPNWPDGHEVTVNDVEVPAADGAGDEDQWAEDMEALTATLNDAQEWQEIEAALAEADRQSKAIVRREMGLP
jgi:hypothetical protein